MIQGITEDDIAGYLANTPSFFERHAELLASVQLASPHGNRAVSLQQRQMDMLRDRIKGLERRIIEMIRHGHDNTSLVDRLHDWTLALMQTADRRALPAVLVEQLKYLFMIPHGALRLWDTDPALADAPFVLQTAGEELRQWTEALAQPYCGVNTGFEAARWCLQPAGGEVGSAVKSQDALASGLANGTAVPAGPAVADDNRDGASSTGSNDSTESAVDQADHADHTAQAAVASLAMIALRRPDGRAFGLLVLASPDPTRYTADMGTDLLSRIGELASASLLRLLSSAAVTAPATALAPHGPGTAPDA